MTDKHDHRRDSEEREFEHSRYDDVPAWVKYTIYAVEKVGIAGATAFCLLYMMFVTMNKLTVAVTSQTTASMRETASLEALIITITGYHSENKAWRDNVSEMLKDIRLRSK